MHTTPLFAMAFLGLALGLFLAPTAAADVTDHVPDDGAARCQKVNGRDVCVGVLENGCALWVSAGFGGCLIWRP